MDEVLEVCVYDDLSSHLSIQFLTIGEVDTTNEKYQAEVLIRSRWYMDEEVEKYDKAIHW